MTYDPHKDVRECFPIFNDIEQAVSNLNQLLEEADKQDLSIRFTQGSKKIPTPDGGTFTGPPLPKLNMTTLSWRRPNNEDNNR